MIRLPLIIQNLELAIEAVKAQPETNFDLEYFRQSKPECGTCFCTIGLLSTVEHFQKQGVILHEFKKPFDGSTGYTLDEQTGPNGESSMAWLDDLFGPAAWNRLFAQAGSGEFDEEHWREAKDDWATSLYSRGMPPEDYPFNYSDKDLALDRLKAQLNEMQNALEAQTKGELPAPPAFVKVEGFPLSNPQEN